jgi:hypothetical protein
MRGVRRSIDGQHSEDSALRAFRHLIEAAGGGERGRAPDVDFESAAPRRHG